MCELNGDIEYLTYDEALGYQNLFEHIPPDEEVNEDMNICNCCYQLLDF